MLNSYLKWNLNFEISIGKKLYNELKEKKLSLFDRIDNFTHAIFCLLVIRTNCEYVFKQF